ncbi:MAG TPA: hypothetical protein PKL57_09680 [Candidatus Wallbacteria bacterium]|nr:hypothetical protein [Candidatus Wallbacteria bacterium]
MKADKSIISREIDFKGRKIKYFEFEYHRYSLAAWRDDCIRNSGRPSLAVTIDRHRDFLSADHERLFEFMNFKDDAGFLDNVDKIAAPANNDFIAFAFYAGYCSDVLAVAYEPYHELEIKSMIQQGEAFYGADSQAHYLACMPSLMDTFAPGCDFQRTPTYREFYERFNAAQSVILDIDLDYFTYQSPDDAIFMRRAEDIKNVFEKIKPDFTRLLDKVTTLAVARESVCCGGTENASEIKALLFKIFKEDYGLNLMD